MCAAKKDSEQVQPHDVVKEVKQKTCFAIMPIADHPDYTPGHFTRVYNHLIKPACEKAGYKVVRADDAKASHMIMFDILKNIVECDMAICDLSSKNANVFYELGLRQAFNKKTILITDGLTNTPFDITGFRYVKYSESLRVDTVQSDVLEISAMLEETESASEDDINSIVNLLKIQPAHIKKVELSENESALYKLIKNLDAKVSNLTPSNRKENIALSSQNFGHLVYNGSEALGAVATLQGKSFDYIQKKYPIFLKSVAFANGDITLGKFIGETLGGDLMFRNGDMEHYISGSQLDRSNIVCV
ncbi:hypothetical protein [Enterobacter sp.]|uniref:hypothetical protein n=1 Tax=Enterobacter sp. TaxID=42895 RepID=UPI002980DBE4|nr:hypothetical protein [Enterobacter sp.]